MSTPMTKEEIIAYAQLVEAVRELYNLLGRGAQQQAAFDVRVSPSLVSSVLSGKYMSMDILTKLEDWARAKLTPETGEVVSAGTSH